MQKLLVSKKHSFAIQAAPYAGDGLARRLVVEAETGSFLEEPTAADAAPFEMSVDAWNADPSLSGFRVVQFLRDPWSRLAQVFRDAIVRRGGAENAGVLDTKHRMIQASDSPFAELVKLLSVLRPDVLAPFFARQLPVVPAADVIVFDPTTAPALASVKSFVASLPCPKTLGRLEEMVAVDEVPPCMMRSYVGAVKPSGFDRSAPPPGSCLYNASTWDLVAEVYSQEAKRFAKPNPFVTLTGDP